MANAVLNQKPYMLAEIIKETPDVTIFRYRAADNSRLDFEPGMFLMLTYANEKTGEKVTRAFSIASTPNSDTIDFFVHMIHGAITSKLEIANVGDMYYMTGPHGQFKLSNEDKKVLFIAGGTGLAPFMSMLEYIDSNKLDTDIIMLYSVRRPDEIIRKERLTELASNIHLKTTITVTRPEDTDTWDSEKGHIDAEMVKRHVNDIETRTVYICGPLPFVKAMKDTLTQLNVTQEKIKADVWG